MFFFLFLHPLYGKLAELSCKFLNLDQALIDIGRYDIPNVQI